MMVMLENSGDDGGFLSSESVSEGFIMVLGV